MKKYEMKQNGKNFYGGLGKKIVSFRFVSDPIKVSKVVKKI